MPLHPVNPFEQQLMGVFGTLPVRDQSATMSTPSFEALQNLTQQVYQLHDQQAAIHQRLDEFSNRMTLFEDFAAGGKDGIDAQDKALHRRISELAAENRELRLSFTRARILLYTSVQNLTRHIDEIWQQLLQSEGRQQGRAQMASERLKRVDGHSNSMKWWTDRIINATEVGVRAADTLRQYTGFLRQMANGAPLPDPENHNRTDRTGARILERCVEWLQRCFVEIRQSTARDVRVHEAVVGPLADTNGKHVASDFGEKGESPPRKRRAIRD